MTLIARPLLLLAALGSGLFTASAHPEGPPPPPPEALEACEGKQAGDACGFASPHGEVSGECFTPSADKPLACRPDEPPPPPPERA